MKKLIKKIIPDKIKNNISSFIPAFIAHKNMKRIRKRIKHDLLTKGKVRVLFFLQYPEMWNSEKSVYEAMRKNDLFDVSILCIPKKNLSTGRYEHKNSAFQFCEKNGLEYVNARDNEQWVKIVADYIFLQRPYDSDMPECYGMGCLARESILCYIPYGFEFTDDIHWDIEYNTSANQCLNFIFADNRCSYEYVIKKNITALVLGARKVFDIGYPRFDLVHSANNDMFSENKFVLLWLPRWSLEEENDKSTFLVYFECLMNLCGENPKLHLIIRPHPLMFDNFIKCGALSMEQMEQIMKRINMTGNVRIDQNEDYLVAFDESNCLLADFTSLLVEYYVTGKPIIYCGKTEMFNDVGKEMSDSMYKANNWSDVKKYISDAMSGAHMDHDKSVSFFRNYNVGEKIKDIIISDIYNY